jgi:hypothetical protein
MDGTEKQVSSLKLIRYLIEKAGMQCMRVNTVTIRRQQWMGNTFITEMLLTGGVRIETGVSGSAYFSWF